MPMLPTIFNQRGHPIGHRSIGEHVHAQGVALHDLVEGGVQLPNLIGIKDRVTILYRFNSR